MSTKSIFFFSLLSFFFPFFFSWGVYGAGAILSVERSGGFKTPPLAGRDARCGFESRTFTFLFFSFFLFFLEFGFFARLSLAPNVDFDFVAVKQILALIDLVITH